MNAFGRMFLEPGAEPPRFSLARIASLVLFVVGSVLLTAAAIDWNTQKLTYGGGILFGAAVLYGWAEIRRMKIGDMVEIEREGK